MLDLLYNLMLESTGRLQKCRIYEMTANKAARSTIAYLIVRDQAHENAFAKALESLGVNWGAVLPIPKTSAEKFPEVKKLLDVGLQSIQYTFSADDESQAAKLYRGASPSNDGTELSTAVMPQGFPMTITPGTSRRVLHLAWTKNCWRSSRPPPKSRSRPPRPPAHNRLAGGSDPSRTPARNG